MLGTWSSLGGELRRWNDNIQHNELAAIAHYLFSVDRDWGFVAMHWLIGDFASAVMPHCRDVERGCYGVAVFAFCRVTVLPNCVIPAFLCCGRHDMAKRGIDELRYCRNQELVEGTARHKVGEFIRTPLLNASALHALSI
jgi:hypothetical protein